MCYAPPSDALSLAERLALILDGLCRTLAARGARERAAGAFLLLLWKSLRPLLPDPKRARPEAIRPVAVQVITTPAPRPTRPLRHTPLADLLLARLRRALQGMPLCVAVPPPRRNPPPWHARCPPIPACPYAAKTHVRFVTIKIRSGAPLCLCVLAALLVPLDAPARTLTVATWDLGWLTLRPAGDPALPDRVRPKRPEDLARLARYAAALHADVIAFQGVDGASAAATVFPPAVYAVHLAADPVLQRSGFAIRRNIPIIPEPDLTDLDPYPDAKFHLRSGADIALRLPAGTVLRLLSVQLKSGCRDAPLGAAAVPACATLGLQADALHDWIAARAAAREPFLILGDFARVMDNDASFEARLAPAGSLLRATAHYASPCWGGANFVDHILAGGAARGWMQPQSLRVMAFRETGGTWRDRLSSHCPVSIRLDLPG